MDYESEQPLPFYDARNLGATSRAAAIAAFIASEVTKVSAPADATQFAAMQHDAAASRAYSALLDRFQSIRYTGAEEIAAVMALPRAGLYAWVSA